MARIRTIKPEFPQSESIGRLSREGRLCFVLLWTLADDSGRLRGNSRMLASLLYPYDDDAKGLMDAWIGELQSEGCVQRYQVEGETYIEISSWLKHQKIDKPSASKIPPPPEKFANPREDSKKNAADQGRDQGPRTKEGKPAADAAREEVWATGMRILNGQGVGESQARSFIGKLCKDYGQLLVLQAVRDCAAVNPAEAKAWLAARCQERKSKGSGNGKFNVHEYGRKRLAESLASEGLRDSPASQAIPSLPDEIH